MKCPYTRRKRSEQRIHKISLSISIKSILKIKWNREVVGQVLGRYNHPIYKIFVFLNFSKETKLDTSNCIKPFTIQWFGVHVRMNMYMYSREHFVDCKFVLTYYICVYPVRSHMYLVYTLSIVTSNQTHTHTLTVHSPAHSLASFDLCERNREKDKKSYSIHKAHVYIRQNQAERTHLTDLTLQKFIVAPSFLL